MDTSTLRCAECGAPVRVADGVLERTCSHDRAPVVASITAGLAGRGGLR